MGASLPGPDVDPMMVAYFHAEKPRRVLMIAVTVQLPGTTRNRMRLENVRLRCTRHECVRSGSVGALLIERSRARSDRRRCASSFLRVHMRSVTARRVFVMGVAPVRFPRD